MQIRILTREPARSGRCANSVLLHILLFCILAFDSAAQGLLTQPKPTTEHSEEPVPMAAFARMETGEWRLGTVHATTWRWGPGRHSIRAHRVGSDVGGNPWRELVIYYWHPDREQIQLVSFHPDIPSIGRGVGEGTIEFDGDTAVTSLELYQPRGKRKLESRWAFDSPDTYNDIILEDNGRGMATLAEWEYTRSLELSPPSVPKAGRAPKPSRDIQPFVPLLGRWEGHEDGREELVQSSFEWMEHLDVVALSVERAHEDGMPEHLLDVYLYHHVGFDELRCLAISATGNIFEGGVTVLEDDSLELDLTRFEEGAVDRRLVRINFTADDALQTRVWSVDGDMRTLVLDVLHHRTPELQGG